MVLLQVVELGRKLMLSGLIGLVGRGTVAQSVTCMLISFYFFAISYKALPFKKPALNRIKTFSEFQIFVRVAFQCLCLNRTNVLVFTLLVRPQAILVVCVILQAVDAGVNFDEQEALTLDDYGEILVVLTMAFLPVTIFFVYHGIKETKQLRREESGDDKSGISDEGQPRSLTEVSTGAKDSVIVEFQNPIALDEKTKACRSE